MEAIVAEGQECRRCKTPVVKRVPKKRSPKKSYWFEWYLYCPNCGNMYMVESARIENPHYKAPAWKEDWLKKKEGTAELDTGFIRNLQALESIAKAPEGLPASALKGIARRALDGINVIDSVPRKGKLPWD